MNTFEHNKKRALLLAGHVLEFGGAAPPGAGWQLAAATLAEGRAWRKFQEICEAQGGFREPELAPLSQDILAPCSGRVIGIDNRRLSRIAKLAGAPKVPCAGIDLLVRTGDFVERDQPLYTLHAGSPGALAYAATYALAQPTTVHVTEDE